MWKHVLVMFIRGCLIVSCGRQLDFKYSIFFVSLSDFGVWDVVFSDFKEVRPATVSVGIPYVDCWFILKQAFMDYQFPVTLVASCSISHCLVEYNFIVVETAISLHNNISSKLLDSFCFWLYHSGCWKLNVFDMDCYVWMGTKLWEAAGKIFFCNVSVGRRHPLKKEVLLYLTLDFNYAWCITFWFSVP